MLQLVRVRTSSSVLMAPGQISSLSQVARGEGHVFLTHATTWQMRGWSGLLSFSHIHKAGSPVTLLKGSTLVCSPGMVQGLLSCVCSR